MESKEDPVSGVEGLVVPTDEADKSSGVIEDWTESKDGLLCSPAACGEVSSSGKPSSNEAQASADANAEYLSSVV